MHWTGPRPRRCCGRKPACVPTRGPRGPPALREAHLTGLSGEPSRPDEAAARGRGDVRRRRRALRPDQRRALARARPGCGAGPSPGRSTPQPGERVLDLAAGTGSSSLPFAAAGRVRGAVRLLARHAAGRQARRTPALAVRRPATRCGCRSPTPSFDAVTISFGLRNVSDVDAALAEMARVTRPGGRLVVCEFSHPTWAPFRTVYSGYLMARAAVGRPPGVEQPGRLRLPGRVDPGLAGPAGAGPADRRRGLDRRRLVAT